jgi:hypothetical protein
MKQHPICCHTNRVSEASAAAAAVTSFFIDTKCLNLSLRPLLSKMCFPWLLGLCLIKQDQSLLSYNQRSQGINLVNGNCQNQASMSLHQPKLKILYSLLSKICLPWLLGLHYMKQHPICCHTNRVSEASAAAAAVTSFFIDTKCLNLSL